MLEAHPDLKASLDDPLPGYSFGQTALMLAAQQANRDMVDVLLRAGADINQKSHWWAGPFHVLDGAMREPWLPSFLIGRGAVLGIHHAVQFGMVDDVRTMLAADPALIHARGGDGQLPLHFAQTVDMAEYLISRGADINARDIDHESTAGQYMVRDRQPVARHLVRRRAPTDVLMAAALGDMGVTRRILDANPEAIRTTVSPHWFPMQDPRAGGSIYIWTLGAEKGAHEIAREFGHEDVFRELMARTPPGLALAVACLVEDETLLAEVASGAPPSVPPEEHGRLLAAARRNGTKAIEMMLRLGWPADVRDASGATALHWAAYHGNVAIVRQMLERGAPVDVKDRTFDGTPFDWAEFASREGVLRPGADYPTVLQLLR